MTFTSQNDSHIGLVETASWEEADSPIRQVGAIEKEVEAKPTAEPEEHPDGSFQKETMPDRVPENRIQDDTLVGPVNNDNYHERRTVVIPKPRLSLETRKSDGDGPEKHSLAETSKRDDKSGNSGHSQPLVAVHNIGQSRRVHDSAVTKTGAQAVIQDHLHPESEAEAAIVGGDDVRSFETPGSGAKPKDERFRSLFSFSDDDEDSDDLFKHSESKLLSAGDSKPHILSVGNVDGKRQNAFEAIFGTDSDDEDDASDIFSKLQIRDNSPTRKRNSSLNPQGAD